MIEAFILILYIVVISPILIYYQITTPLVAFMLLFLFSLPGLYAMYRGAPYLPSARKKVTAMITLANINSDSIVYDLGSGDGRLVFASQQAGAKKSIGYELSIPVYLYSKIKSLFIPRTQIRYKDFWFDAPKFKDADVIFCFLMIKSMQTFETKIWPHLKPGALVVSNAFRIPNQVPIYDQDNLRIYRK